MRDRVVRGLAAGEGQAGDRDGLAHRRRLRGEVRRRSRADQRHRITSDDPHERRIRKVRARDRVAVVDFVRRRHPRDRHDLRRDRRRRGGLREAVITGLRATQADTRKGHRLVQAHSAIGHRGHGTRALQRNGVARDNPHEGRAREGRAEQRRRIVNPVRHRDPRHRDRLRRNVGREGRQAQGIVRRLRAGERDPGQGHSFTARHGLVRKGGTRPGRHRSDRFPGQDAGQLDPRIRGARGERAVVGFAIDRDPANRGHCRADRRRRGRLRQGVVRRIRATENEARDLHRFICAHRGGGKGGRDVRRIQRHPAAGGHTGERRGIRADFRLRRAVIGFVVADDPRHRQRGTRDRGRRGGLRDRVVGRLGAGQRQTADRHRLVGAHRSIGKFSEHVRRDEAHRRDVGCLHAHQHRAARHHGRIRLLVEGLVGRRDARDRDRLRVDRGTQRRLTEVVVGAVAPREGETRHLDRALDAHFAIVKERRRTRGIEVHQV